MALGYELVMFTKGFSHGLDDQLLLEHQIPFTPNLDQGIQVWNLKWVKEEP